MSNVDTTQPAPEGPTGTHDPVPMSVDWLLAALTGLFGFALAAVGGVMFANLDREAISDAIVEEDTTVEGLTRYELVTASEAFLDWLAFGLVLMGVLVVVAAAGFALTRRRTRNRVSPDGGTTATFWGCAAYGAAAAVVASFVPGSTIVGGGVAAYLRDSDDSVRVGAATGLVGAALTVPLVAFLGVGLLAGGAAIGELGGGAVLAAIAAVGLVLTVAVNAGLGALGGFLADRLD